MTWQEIAVTLIGIAVAATLLRRVVCLFRDRGRGSCGCCDRCCALRRSGRESSRTEVRHRSDRTLRRR